MKKRKLSILAFSTVFVMALAGCGGTTGTGNGSENGVATGNREAQLEEKITQLLQQIAILEAEKASNGTAGQTNTTENTNGTDNNGNTNGTDDLGAADTNEGDTGNTVDSVYTVDSLTKEVNQVVKKTENATPSKDKETKRHTTKREARTQKGDLRCALALSHSIHSTSKAGEDET